MTDPFGSALPVLDTERLRLRPVRRTDAEAILQVFGDDAAMRFWSHEPLADLDAAHGYIDRMVAGFASRTLFQWVVADRETDGLLGTVTVYQWDHANHRAEVGFMLGRAHWGRGFAQEAVRAVLRFAFEAMDLHRVEADTHPGNAASLRLLERLGFRREGLLRQRFLIDGSASDSEIFGLLQEEWRGRGPRR